MGLRTNVKLTRFLFALGACVVRSAFPFDKASAGYPERIIKIVVPFAPGGGTDVIARALAQEMAKDLGASVIIENKPGAGTIIGTQAVAASEPDGYTLLMGTFANAVNPSLNPKLPYDAHNDFAPVSLIARSSAAADGFGSRCARLCRGSLVWPVRAGQNAARDHRAS